MSLAQFADASFAYPGTEILSGASLLIRPGDRLALLAPNGHAWEIQYCAALAATIRGEDTKIIVRSAFSPEIPVSGKPGIGIDWQFEPAFGKIQWQS